MGTVCSWSGIGEWRRGDRDYRNSFLNKGTSENGSRICGFGEQTSRDSNHNRALSLLRSQGLVPLAL